MSEQQAILDLGARWVAAEVAADTDTLAELAHPDLRLVGPLGFILDRDAWLQRYASGDLDTTALVWDQVEVRLLGDTAITVGRQQQAVSYRGHPNAGDFRVSHVFVRSPASPGGWQIAGIHLSQLSQPPVPPS